MPDDRDVRKPKPALLDAPADDDLTPVNAPSFVIIGKMAERIKEIGTKLNVTSDKLDASIDRDEQAHKDLNEGLRATNAEIVSLKVISAKMDGKLDILVGDRVHEQKLEQIETVTENKLAIIQTKAKLDDTNNLKATRRQLWLTIAKTAAKVLGGLATLVVGAIAGAGLHNC